MNIQVENICADFLTFWEEANKVETLEEKKLLWKKIYEEPNKDIFDIYFGHFGDRNNLDVAIMDKYPKYIEKIKKVNGVIEAKIKEVSMKCSELFQVYNIDFNYVVMVGTFSSDGWGCIYNNKPTIFFAIEFEKDPNYFDIFLAHEITHNFHMNINKINSIDNLADHTLAEGMAVVASKVLYPGFADTAYLNFSLNGDSWLCRCNNIFKDIRDEYIETLESNKEDIMKKYFWGKISEDKDVPNRIGYVIGDKVVTALIENYSFYELASWNSNQALAQVKHILNTIL